MPKTVKKRVSYENLLGMFYDPDFPIDMADLDKGWRNNEDLAIYLCIFKLLKNHAIQDIPKDLCGEEKQLALKEADKKAIDEFYTKYILPTSNLKTLKDKVKYLKEHQPFMNETEELYDICTRDYIAPYLKSYISYNGFVMNNSDGDASDWEQEFWLKYVKICNFYRDRWFHPENLTKETKVCYNQMQYKEFIYICRMSITGERRHQAFLATQKPDSSLFKSSLDFKLDNGKNKNEGNRNLIDTIPDNSNDSETILDELHVHNIKNYALEIASTYDEGKYVKSLKKFYFDEDSNTLDKNIATLGKIFLYKAGLISPKVLSFIKSLSSTYKAKYNISEALINRQLASYKVKKTSKIPSYKDILEDEGKTRIGLLLRKRTGD